MEKNWGWIALASLIGAAGGSFLFMAIKGKKKCSCADKKPAETTPVQSEAGNTDLPQSQPIAAAAAVNFDGWGNKGY